MIVAAVRRVAAWLVLISSVTAACAASTSAASSLTVDDCIHLALDRAPALVGAAADIRAADARVRAARAAYWPRASAQSQYGRAFGYDETITNGGVTALGIAIDAPLLDGGARAAELAAARAHLRSATTLAQQRRSDTAAAVRLAFYTAVAARADSTTQRTVIEAMDNYLSLLQRQARIGLAPATDAPRVELAIATARAAQRNADTTANASTRELAIWTGAPIQADALVDASPAPPPAGDNDIDASPVIVDARAAAEAAWRDVDAVRAEGRARLGLTADGGFLGVSPGPTFRENGGGQFLVGFSLPLFDGGALAARAAAADAAARSADAKVNQVRESLVVALAHADAEAERARADIDAWRRMLPTASEGFLLMRARYVGGADVRLLDVIDALNQSVDAQLALTHATLALQIATTTRAQLLGRTDL